MRWLRALCLVIACNPLILGCTPEDMGQIVDALSKIPFVDRTEKEVNNWFDNTTIVDDKKHLPATVNGEPTILMLTSASGRTINGQTYSAVLCITQYNSVPDQQLKYAARAAIVFLDNPNLFECGPVELGSCDGDPMEANITFLTEHPLPVLESAFRSAVNEWLNSDIVPVLKSTTNKDGLANPSQAAPREPAKTRGTKCTVKVDSNSVKSIAFLAE